MLLNGERTLPCERREGRYELTVTLLKFLHSLFRYALVANDNLCVTCLVCFSLTHFCMARLQQDGVHARLHSLLAYVVQFVFADFDSWRYSRPAGLINLKNQ